MHEWRVASGEWMTSPASAGVSSVRYASARARERLSTSRHVQLFYFILFYFLRGSLSSSYCKNRSPPVRKEHVFTCQVGGWGGGLTSRFTETPNTANGLPFLDYQRFLAFLPIFYLGMMEVTPERWGRCKSELACSTREIETKAHTVSHKRLREVNSKLGFKRRVFSRNSTRGATLRIEKE